MDLNELLSADERDKYRQHMEVIAEDGSVAVSEADMARRMLHLLVTESGKGNEVGEVHIGRATILPLLIKALVGPDPDPTAWIEAIANGSFDLTNYKAYGTPGAKTGSPGTYLPRLLKRYEKAASRPSRRSEAEAADLRTALGILIATTLLRELKKATNARAALGAAWPLTEAVSGRRHAELRKLIAHFGNEARFLAHIAGSIEKAVASWAETNTKGEIWLTNKDVDNHVPSRDRVTAHFERQKNDAARREDALVEFGRLMLSGELPSDETATRAIERLSEDQDFRDWRMTTSGSLPPLAAYLSDREPASASEAHHRCLRQLMPIAAGPSTAQQIEVCALGVARLIFPENPVQALGIPLVDRVTDKVAREVYNYGWDVGPPPPEAALAHLGWFEASACFSALSRNWPAREAWRRAGLMPCEYDNASYDRVSNRLRKLVESPLIPEDWRFDN